MRVKKEPKRNWDNICHYSSDLEKVKNLNEIYRFVFYKPKKYHIAPNRAEWVYIDISLDDIFDDNSEMLKAKRIIAGNYDFISRLRSTGIKDKFGNLIFEADITECKIGSNFETGCVTYCASRGGYSKGYTDIGSYQKGTEIIGDIFQTPELDWRKEEHQKQFGINN